MKNNNYESACYRCNICGTESPTTETYCPRCRAVLTIYGTVVDPACPEEEKKPVTVSGDTPEPSVVPNPPNPPKPPKPGPVPKVPEAPVEPTKKKQKTGGSWKGAIIGFLIAVILISSVVLVFLVKHILDRYEPSEDGPADDPAAKVEELVVDCYRLYGNEDEEICWAFEFDENGACVAATRFYITHLDEEDDLVDHIADANEDFFENERYDQCDAVKCGYYVQRDKNTNTVGYVIRYEQLDKEENLAFLDFDGCLGWGVSGHWYDAYNREHIKDICMDMEVLDYEDMVIPTLRDLPLPEGDHCFICKAPEKEKSVDNKWYGESFCDDCYDLLDEFGYLD